MHRFFAFLIRLLKTESDINKHLNHLCELCKSLETASIAVCAQIIRFGMAFGSLIFLLCIICYIIIIIIESLADTIIFFLF